MLSPYKIHITFILEIAKYINAIIISKSGMIKIGRKGKYYDK